MVIQNQSSKSLLSKMQSLNQKTGRVRTCYNAVHHGLEPASPFTDTGRKPSVIRLILAA